MPTYVNYDERVRLAVYDNGLADIETRHRLTDPWIAREFAGGNPILEWLVKLAACGVSRDALRAAGSDIPIVRHEHPSDAEVPSAGSTELPPGSVVVTTPVAAEEKVYSEQDDALMLSTPRGGFPQPEAPKKKTAKRKRMPQKRKG